jgi:DNA polymerase elongation subunit (family B)
MWQDKKNRQMPPRTVKFKANYWSFEETPENELYIYIGGMTQKGKTVLVKVTGFYPSVYLELPKRVSWNRYKCKELFEFFQKRMGDQAPLSFKMLEKDVLHYKEPVYTLCLDFPTDTAIRNKFHKICANSKSLYIPGVGSFTGGDFLVHEQNIDPIIKFTAKQDIKLAGWIKATEDDTEDDLTEEERKFSTADIDFETDWGNIVSYEQKKMIVTPLKYCSFDIECYSKNHNSKLPDPEIPENIIFQIIMIFGCFGYSENKMKMILLTLYDPKDIDGVELRRYKSEKHLLLDFSRLIVSEDPDIFTGYNIMKFDWNYLIIRAKLCGIYPQFSKISRLIGQPAIQKTARWSSSAYGQQEFLYLDCHGRTNMDVLPEIERNYKLPTYSLKAVSEFFLQDSKEDISARQLFMSVKLTQEIGPLVEKKVNIFQLKKIKRRIEEIFPLRQTHGVMKKLRGDLLKSTPNNIQKLVKKAIWICGVYCKKDGILPIKLAEKLNLWTTMEQMANVMNVPATYLHTRGQQIKVIAQLYRETLINNLIIPHKAYTDVVEKYQGAVVFKATKGDYENVACLDFAHLYPAILITYNICHTTLLKDDNPTPDSECHVLEWEDHVKCEHDPQKRKPKKNGEDILCKHHRYRFRKMKIVLGKNGEVEYQNEGVLPRIVRRLLTERKQVKRRMNKEIATLSMHDGKADKDDIDEYKSYGWEIINKGSLTEKEVEEKRIKVRVDNAEQLALKVSANSIYGSLGAQKGYIPLVPGAASITAMGREWILSAIKRIYKAIPSSELVYGDTDSCMILFKGKNLRESFVLAKEGSKIATHYLKCRIIGLNEDDCITLKDTNETIRLDKVKKDEHFHRMHRNDKLKVLEYQLTPIDLEFENMYGRFLLLTKKRYVAYIVNIDGGIKSVTKKGVVLARRDNCEYLRLTYKKAATAVLDKKSEEEVMNIIYDKVNALFTRQIQDTHLIIYMGVKKITDYAKSKEVKDVRGRVLDKVHIDMYGDPIDSKENTLNPLDPRLVYPNLPQVLLARKMLERGDDVPANTRLEFLYLQTKDALHQGDKAEDYTYYKENKEIENLRPDNLHYLEKQLSRPITELLTVKYPREPVPYEKLDDAKLRCIREMDDELISQRIARTRVFTKERPLCQTSSDRKTCVGWKALLPSIEKEWVVKKKVKWWDDQGNVHKTKGLLKGGNPINWGLVRIQFINQEKKQISDMRRAWNGTNEPFPEYFKQYKFKGNMAKVEYILHSAQTPGKTEINPNKYTELVDVCKKWKSRTILNEHYKSFGLRIRPTKHPSRSGEELPVLYPVMLTKNIGKYEKGTLCQVYATYVKETRVTKRSTIVLRCDYDILMKDGKVIKDLLRRDITTYLYRDSAIMKDILDARTYYNEVINSLNEKNNTPFVVFKDIDTVSDSTYYSD